MVSISPVAPSGHTMPSPTSAAMPWHSGTAETTAPVWWFFATKSGSFTAVPSAQNQMPFAGILPSETSFALSGLFSRSAFALTMSARSTSAFWQPVGSRGPIFSPKWSCGGMSLMPFISACACTAMCLNEWPRFTVMPAFSARAANSGSLKSSVIISSDTAPSMEPAEWDKMRFSSNGMSPDSKVTMLQR